MRKNMFPLVPQNQSLALSASDVQTFEKLVEMTLDTLESATSKATYKRVYKQWLEWCSQDEHNPTDIRPDMIKAFLVSRHVSKKTRQWQLSAFRKLARMLAVLDYENPKAKAIYEALRMMRVPTENISTNERQRKAFNAQSVYKVLDVWTNEEELTHLRNQAIITVMFYTGMRRSEVKDLRWTDINFEDKTILVRHGKGDKERTVKIVGDDFENPCIRALSNLKTNMPNDYQYCFVRIRRWDVIAEDKPMHATTFNAIVKKTSELAGEEFTPHDARRTLGTDLARNGVPVRDIQDQLGHANVSTTLDNYVLPAKAKDRPLKSSY